MSIPKSELKIERVRGTGPGGQHKNKTCSAVRITHIPTGLQAYADERSQRQSYDQAMKCLEARIQGQRDQKVAARKKADRDRRVQETRTVRTYNECRNEVVDHRSKVKMRFDDVVKRGNLNDLLDL